MSHSKGVHTFTRLGFRTMPIGQAGFRMTRDDKGKKVIVDSTGTHHSFAQAMPANWTSRYGEHCTKHANTPLGGLICGELSNKEAREIEVFALDCDNGAAWDLFTALDPTYKFKFASIGKQSLSERSNEGDLRDQGSRNGGTVLYQLPDSLKDVKQFSLNNGIINIEYMARRPSGINAMVYLPTEANETKEAIQPGAELDFPPQQVISLIKSLIPKVSTSALAQAQNEVRSISLPFNAPLLEAYVQEVKDDTNSFNRIDTSELAKKVYHVFTTRKFRDALPYKAEGWLHPNDDHLIEVGPYSEYIVGVSAIAGADPSISPELYTDFIQAVNAQLDNPMPIKRLLTEVISPMVHQKAKINGKPIWKYDEKWDKSSLTIVNQYGETLEYFTLESAASKYLEFNHLTKELIELPSITVLRDQIYAKCNDPNQNRPEANVVKKLKLVQIQDSVKYPVGVHTDAKGHTILNTAEATFPLQVLRNPEIFPDSIDEANTHVQAFNLFIAHLLNDDPEAMLFLKQVIAYHGRNLTCIPVILYMIGVGGAGKSIFAEVLELLFGENTTSRPVTEQLVNRFNDYLEDTAILILSETSDSSARVQAGIKGLLKTITGESSLNIEPKGKRVKKNVPIFVLPVLIANDPWYQEDTADRRLFSITPRVAMTESQPILEFEQTFGGRLVDCIRQGILLGIISKYLSQFCPAHLPPVPLTRDKKELSLAQQDPIMVVKNIIATQSWYQLFDLMEEHSIDVFFTFMESTKARNKNALFKQQLVDLVSGLRGGDTFTLSDAEISKAFTTRWLPRHAMQYRPANAAFKKLGYVKWDVPIAKPYEEWKLAKLMEEEK